MLRRNKKLHVSAAFLVVTFVHFHLPEIEFLAAMICNFLWLLEPEAKV